MASLHRRSCGRWFALGRRKFQDVVARVRKCRESSNVSSPSQPSPWCSRQSRQKAGAIVSPTAGTRYGSRVLSRRCAIERTIDQSGLTAGFTSGVTDFDMYIGTSPSHIVNFNTEWFAPGGTFTQNIDYDLGALYSGFRMAFWTKIRGERAPSAFSATDATFGATTLLGTFGPTNWPVARFLRTSSIPPPTPSPATFD